MRHVQRLFLVNLFLFVFACHNEPASRDNEAADRGSLCTTAGATLNSTTNECECSSGQKWSGSRCEAEVAAAVKPQEMELAAQETAKPPQNDIKEMAPATLMPEAKAVSPEQKLTEKPSTLSPAEVASLKKACEKAHADWVDAEQFCQCPENKVLIGQKCTLLQGVVTDDACMRAVRPGRWTKGDCKCAASEVFVPQRGGCVAPNIVASHNVATKTGQFTCESSLSNGKWDLSKNRCQCPSGRIWLDGLCALQSRLSSAVICESGFNGGTWDSSHKRCQCQNGQMWLNQSCMDPHALPSRNVCESEFNRGTWNTTRQSCSCPRGARWNSKNLQCQGRAG